MEQIIIHQADGTVRPLIDRLNPTNIASAKQKREINNADTVSMSIQSTNPQVFNIGDWISVFGRVYRLNRLPKVKRMVNLVTHTTLNLKASNMTFCGRCTTLILTPPTTPSRM